MIFSAKFRKGAALFALGEAYLYSAQMHRDAALVQKGIAALTQSYNLNQDNLNAIQMLSQAYSMIGDKAQAQNYAMLLQQKQQQ